jgi:hypothetical protein
MIENGEGIGSEVKANMRLITESCRTCASFIFDADAFVRAGDGGFDDWARRDLLCQKHRLTMSLPEKSICDEYVKAATPAVDPYPEQAILAETRRLVETHHGHMLYEAVVDTIHKMVADILNGVVKRPRCEQCMFDPNLQEKAW